MNPFKKDEPCFLVNAFEHAGHYRGIHGGTMKCWEVKNTLIKPFSDIIKAVCAELGICRFPRSMVVMFDLFLRGACTSSIEVYVMLAGASEQHRKRAVKHLKKSALAKNYPGLKMDHWDWPPNAPQVVMVASDEASLPWATVHRSKGYGIRFSGKTHERTTSCKLANITYHIVATDRDGAGSTVALDPGETSDPCSVCRHLDGSCLSCQERGSKCPFVANPSTDMEKRGVLSHYVAVGGRRYLLAPAHIFLGDEPEESDDFTDADDSDSESSSDIESSFDVMLRAGSATPPDLESRPASDGVIETTLSDRLSFLESTKTQEKRHLGAPSSNTAPTIPCAEVLSIELDYALVPFPPTGETDLETDLSYLVEETTAKLPFQNDSDAASPDTADRLVSVTTPSQGLVRGNLSTRPVMMRLPYSKSFSMLYPLELPSPVKKGDCGSVIFDHLSRVYGFIAAGSTAESIAYIVPAVEILRDIRSKSDRMSAILSLGPELDDLAAKNEAQRATDDNSNRDLVVLEAGPAEDNEPPGTEAETIGTLQQNLTTIEEEFQSSRMFANDYMKDTIYLEGDFAETRQRHLRNCQKILVI
jgi:hypothetical protein